MYEFHPRFGERCRLWAWSGRWTRIVTPPLRPPSNRDPARGGALRRLSDGDKRQSRERRIRQRSPRARCRELSPNPASKVSTSNRAFGFKIKSRPKRLSLASALGAGTCPSYGGYVATKSSGAAQTSQTQGRPSGISYRPNKRGVHMKKLFLGSVALVALGLVAPAAFAAERPVPYTPPPPPAPVYTWSGCYVGASAGSSSGKSQHFTTAGSTLFRTTTVVPAGANITDSFDLSGFIGGGQIGCNWQLGVWVIGVEGDGSATNKEGQAFEPLVFANVNRAAWVSQTQERWLVTARGRLGLTNFWWFGPQTLVYVTGGGAWAKIDTSEFFAGGAACAPGGITVNCGIQGSNTRSGWTVGGGLEYALGYGWSAK